MKSTVRELIDSGDEIYEYLFGIASIPQEGDEEDFDDDDVLLWLLGMWPEIRAQLLADKPEFKDKEPRLAGPFTAYVTCSECEHQWIGRGAAHRVLHLSSCLFCGASVTSLKLSFGEAWA